MIDLEPTKEQELIRKVAREFIDNEVTPHVNDWEEEGDIPESVVHRAGDLGLLGAAIPEEYGGAGLDAVTNAMIIEEVGRGCSSLRTTFSVNSSLFGQNVLLFGNEEQKQRYLPGVCTGRERGAWGLTEVHSGSDAAGMRTTATPEGDGYTLNGSKYWISDGGKAEHLVVYARVGPKGEFDPKTKKDKLAAFVIHRDDAGFSTGSVTSKGKLGLRASKTAELLLEDCHIPADRMLGEVGDGWKQAMTILNGGRLSVAAGAVGIAVAAHEASVDYCQGREAFGRPIGKFQLVQQHLARQHMDIEAGRQLVWKAAWMKDQGMDNTLAVSTCKLFTAEMVMRVTESAVQVHGGNGYSDEYPVERYFRDAKICGIYEGTNEIHQIIMGNKVLGYE